MLQKQKGLLKKDKYYPDYKAKHDTIRGAEFKSKANDLKDRVKTLQTECSKMLSTMDGWEGMAKGSCTNVVASIQGKIEESMRNITQNLIPACEACEELDELLVQLEEEDAKLAELIEDRDKKIDDAIKQVEAIIEVQTERIKKDEDRIEELEKSTKTINENLNKFNKATSRNAVYKLANELIAKQWMSQSDYESLQELSDVYMKSGDSHYVIPNIIQRALNLPVLTDEEIEAKMSRHRADFKL